MTKNPTAEQRAEKLLADLRAANIEAAGLLKDIRAERRGFSEQVNGVRAVLDRQVRAEVEALQQEFQRWLDEQTRVLSHKFNLSTEAVIRALTDLGIEGLARINQSLYGASRSATDIEGVIRDLEGTVRIPMPDGGTLEIED